MVCWCIACINSVVLVCLNSLSGGLVSCCALLGSSFVVMFCCFFSCCLWLLYCCLYYVTLFWFCDCVVWVSWFVDLWVKFVFVFGVGIAGCDYAGCVVMIACRFVFRCLRLL